MALVGRDAGVDGGRDERAGFGQRDEERLGARASFGLFDVVVSLGASILVRTSEENVRNESQLGSYIRLENFRGETTEHPNLHL